MPSKLLKLALKPFGYVITEDRPYLDVRARLSKSIAARGINLMLDVGANRGQFGKSLFKSGYQGRLVSIEPTAEAYAALQETAAKRDNWLVYRRCALGAANGSAEINIAGNSQSSSFLPMTERHLSAAPHSQYVGTEVVDVLTLDEVLEEPDFRDAHPYGIKIDVQGYEQEVLNGLVRRRPMVSLVYMELSLVELYKGEARFTAAVDDLTKDGFRCISITPNFVDRETYEVLDVNALFVRR